MSIPFPYKLDPPRGRARVCTYINQLSPPSDINFNGGTTTVSVGSSAYTLVVDCGDCTGTWDFSGLSASGGKGHIIAANKATVSCPVLVSEM